MATFMSMVGAAVGLFVYGYMWKWFPRIWLLFVSLTIVPLFTLGLSTYFFKDMGDGFLAGVGVGAAIASGGWASFVILMNFRKIGQRAAAWNRPDS